MSVPLVVILSGPESTRAKAELALEKANLITIIPPTEWPINRQSYRAEHWPHLTQLPSGQGPDEEHGFLAVLAETEAAFHAAYRVVEKARWVLRVHHELPERPAPNPLTELLERMSRRIEYLERQLPVPPMAGGALESGAGFAMQAGSYAAAQTRRAVFWGAQRTSANTPGLLNGGLLSSADMQLSNAASGLVVYTSTGECLIPGTEATSQGGYYAFNSSQTSTTLATANASNPRIDLICATAADAAYTIPTGGTSGSVTIQAVTGTPTSGATLTNLSGAPALPGSSLLLGYVLVPAAATNLTSGDIANKALAATSQIGLGGSGVARGWRNASLSLAGGSTWTKIPLDSASYNPGGNLSTSAGRYNVSNAGYYQVNANMSTSVTTGTFAVGIYKNGTLVASGNEFIAGGTSSTYAASDILSCASSDYIELWGFNTNTGSEAISVGQPYFSFLSVVQVG